MERLDRKQKHGALTIGIIFFFVGVGWLLRQMNFPFPDWLFSWEMILIIVGLVIGIKNNFRDAAWFILILIGSIFLIRDIFPFLTFYKYFWPVALIALGLFLILRPRRRSDYHQAGRENMSTGMTGEISDSSDLLDYTAAFGGIKKNILSKNFRGGEVTSIFGGSELNFLQADIQGTVMLEVTQIFGGTKIIVPAHWEVKSDMTAIFGGIDDKRATSPNVDHSKVLVLDGTSIFGGIELVSY
jgi:predicted membrane protein